MSHVKVLLYGDKRYRFLTAGGGTTLLLVHALTWSAAEAEKIAADLVRDNPGVVRAAKAVPA